MLLLLLSTQTRFPNILLSEAATRGVLRYKVFLEILQSWQEDTCVRVSFTIKLTTWGLQLYQKRDSGKYVFLWIFAKFLIRSFFTEHLRMAAPALLYLLHATGPNKLAIKPIRVTTDRNFTLSTLLCLL